MDPRHRKESVLSRVGTFIATLPLLVVVAGFVLLLSPFLLGFGAFYWIRGLWLNRLFRRDFASRGTLAIVVYSESPHWQDYFEQQVFPLLEHRGVILNWSERREWGKRPSLPIRVYEHHRPHREFNPYALVFGPKGRPAEIPFFLAFRDNKHGKPQSLEKAVSRFWSKLEEASQAWERERT